MGVKIGFKFAVNGQSFVCGETYTGVGSNPDAGGQIYRGRFARFYVYGVRLMNGASEEVPVTLTDDGVWQVPSKGVVEIDGESGTGCAGTIGNLEVVGTVPRGTYSGLKLTVGLPNDVNHLLADAQPSPLNQSDMYWSWTGGYRFLRIEGWDQTGTKSLSGGLLHLGSANCLPNDSPSGGGGPIDFSKGATCAYPNTVDLAFDDFDPESSKVVFDIGTLFGDTDLVGGSGGCMSNVADPACPPILKKLALPYRDFTSGAVIVPDGGQTVFTKE
jgi:uncharacterized repeat protein (TIGR04052 family)